MRLVMEIGGSWRASRIHERGRLAVIGDQADLLNVAMATIITLFEVVRQRGL